MKKMPPETRPQSPSAEESRGDANIRPVRFKLFSRFGKLACKALLIAGFASLLPLAQADPIQFWKMGSPGTDESKTLLKWFDQWNAAHPDTKVTAQFFPHGDYEKGTVLVTAFASGTGPDVFWVAPGQFVSFVRNGVAADLSDLFTPEFRNDVSPIAIDGVSLGGKPYAVPFEQEPLGLFYNKPLMEKAGVEVPKTWNELLTACEKLKAKNIIPIVIEPTPSNYENFTWFPFLWQAGGEAVDPDLTKASFASDATAKALDLWGTLIKKGYAPRTSSELTANAPATAFGNGRAAMEVVGFWAVRFLKMERPNLQFEVASLPYPEDGKPASAYGGWLLMVNAKSKNLEAAKKLASWMFMEDPQRPLEWCTVTATKFSPRKSVMSAAKDFFDKDPNSTFRDAIMPTARPEPRYPAEMEKIITDALQSVMFRDVTGKAAADEAQTKLQALLDSLNKK